MNKRKWQISAAIAALLVLNIWRWWPVNEEALRAGSVPAYAVDTGKLRLSVDAVFEELPMKRNPFSTAAVQAPEPEPIAETPEEASVLTEQEQAPSAAALETAMGNLKLAGVLYRRGARYAYLLESGQGHLVEKGAVLFGRYRVEAIDVRSVTMKDMTSEAVARLLLSEM